MAYEQKNKPNVKVKMAKSLSRTGQLSESKEFANVNFNEGEVHEAERNGNRITIKMKGYVNLFSFDISDVQIIE